MGDNSGRSGSHLSDSSSNISGYPADASYFDGSFDNLYGSGIHMSPFLSFANCNSIYSPQPFVKPIESCRQNVAILERKGSKTDNDENMFTGGNDLSLPISQPQKSSFVGNFSGNVRSTRLLPSWAVDLNGHIRTDLTIFEVITNGSLIDFAMDRMGVKFLEQSYPPEPENEVHRLLFEKLTEHPEVFMGLCLNAAGNFFIQKIVEFANLDEQERLIKLIDDSDLIKMCMDKFACRVIQLAVQKFAPGPSSKLILSIANLDMAKLCTDQCAIHVLQKIVKTTPIGNWRFFVKFLCRDDNLMTVCQDKYGCRLVQQTIDKLSDNPKGACFNTRLQLLHGLMNCVTSNCYRLASNEFANYVVQYVIKSSGVIEVYRDALIEKCLLRNLLSMSQDKYASHVVEGAFLFAPQNLLTEMMDEIFDGYVRDHETNRDALDILLFHQYGNYVVQQMISLCISALLGKEERKLNPEDMKLYSKWFERIKLRVTKNATRLERFSSGKKIIESIQKFPFHPSMFTSHDNSLWTFNNHSSILNDTTAAFANQLNISNNLPSVFDD